MEPICYLCGEPIATDASVDHVPPRQFFAPALRQKLNLSELRTLPAHGACNAAYSKDEEYVTWTLSSVALGSPSADQVVAHHVLKTQKGKAIPLAAKILAQFDDRPSGLHLPGGLVAVRVEGARVKRVLWKIVRGLHMLEHSEYVPREAPFSLELIEPEAKGPTDLDELWERVKAAPSLGSYPGVFDYKYLHVAGEAGEINAWGMLLWDRIMAFIAHVVRDGNNAT